jgi:hypothetical protein
MFKRFAFLLIMVAAIGLPYLATSTDLLSYFGSSRTSGTDSRAAAASGGYLGQPSTHAGAPQPVVPGQRPAVENDGPRDLNEVLRFDGTPGWVLARWPRVTAGLAELDLQGYRVALVTGTGEEDLAGSLTYYFDKDQRVKFITFKGTTGNPRKLIALVTSRYSLKQQPTDDPSLALYQMKWNGKPQSELRIRTAHVVRADQPHSRYQVELAMKRP